MSKPLTIGLVGLDTSHVTAFAKLLHDRDDPAHIPGARIVAGFPGASEDFELSRSRVEKFTTELRDQHGVEILGSAAAVAQKVDLVFISSVDGRKHRGFFEQTVKSKKPTFIDKPFTAGVADAEAILEMARRHNVPVMSCSSLRYADPFAAALADTSPGAVVGIDAAGPMALEPALPGLFWYGVHCVELLVAALGAGCARVSDVATDDVDLVTAAWGDGRVGTIRGMRSGHKSFAVTLHREKGPVFVRPYESKRPPYAPMLEAILRTLPQGRSDVPEDQMLDCVRLMQAANASRASGGGGAPVELGAAVAGTRR